MEECQDGRRTRKERVTKNEWTTGELAPVWIDSASISHVCVARGQEDTRRSDGSGDLRRVPIAVGKAEDWRHVLSSCPSWSKPIGMCSSNPCLVQ